MRLGELKARLQVLGLKPAGAARAVEEALDLLEGSQSEDATRYHLYEIGLSSTSPALQVNWIHALRRDGLGNERRRELVQRKADAVGEAARIAERSGGTGFALELFEKVLSLLGSSGSAGDRSLYSFEWDPRASRFSKLTLYGGIYGADDAARLAGLLKVGEPKAERWLSRGDLWNFGVDFLPGGRADLKIYRRRPFAEALAKRRLGADALRLHAERPFHDLASMTRLRVGEGPPHAVKWGAGFEQSVSVADLAASPALRRHAGFLKPAAERLGNLEISYAAWYGGGLGLYCGRGLKAWLKWLAQPAAGPAASGALA